MKTDLQSEKEKKPSRHSSQSNLGNGSIFSEFKGAYT